MEQFHYLPGLVQIYPLHADSPSYLVANPDDPSITELVSWINEEEDTAADVFTKHLYSNIFELSFVLVLTLVGNRYLVLIQECRWKLG